MLRCERLVTCVGRPHARGVACLPAGMGMVWQLLQRCMLMWHRQSALKKREQEQASTISRMRALVSSPSSVLRARRKLLLIHVVAFPAVAASNHPSLPVVHKMASRAWICASPHLCIPLPPSASSPLHPRHPERFPRRAADVEDCGARHSKVV